MTNAQQFVADNPRCSLHDILHNLKRYGTRSWVQYELDQFRDPKIVGVLAIVGYCCPAHDKLVSFSAGSDGMYSSYDLIEVLDAWGD